MPPRPLERRVVLPASVGLVKLWSTKPVARPDLAEQIRMPAHVLYNHWKFGTPVGCIEWDLEIVDDPGTSVGEYLCLFSGSIDGSHCYLGLQTNVRHPGLGRGIGKGLIFSTWWSFDAADTRLADDGFRELGTHEGNFVGVRKPYQWGAGPYRVVLRRGEQEVRGAAVLDWFDLAVQALHPAQPHYLGNADGVAAAPAWAGAICFPRRDPAQPACAQPGPVTFMEVYSGARSWADVARWIVEISARGDSRPCRGGRTEYPAYPHDQLMPNCNIAYEPGTDAVRLSIGAGVVKQDEAQTWQSTRSIS